MLRHSRNVSAKTIHVGIAKNKTHVNRHTGEIDSTASIYQIHEEGLGHVPKRPTLRPAVKKFSTAKHAKDIMRGTIHGTYINDMTKAGDDYARVVRKEIVNLKSPPIKQVTIDNRVNAGTTNPLVDTGQLVGQIGHVIK